MVLIHRAIDRHLVPVLALRSSHSDRTDLHIELGALIRLPNRASIALLIGSSGGSSGGSSTIAHLLAV